MRIRVDPESDALHLRLSEREIAESEEVSPGVVLDYDAEGHLVGVEVLGVREHLSAADLSHVEDDKIVGIEILDASERPNPGALLPVHCGSEVARAA